MKHDYTDEEIKTAWKDSLSLRAFLDALPERPQAAGIASLKDSLLQAQEAAKDLLAQHDKAQAELAALRTPIQSDAGISLGQVAFEAFCPGNTWSYLNHLKVPWEAAAQAVAAVVLAQAELSTLRQPILADDDRSLGQVLHEILDEGLSWDRLLKGDQEQCKLAAQAVADVVLAQAVRRMEAVPVNELGVLWDTKQLWHERMELIRARLISAAKGEWQPVVVNEPPQDERQPGLSGESEKQDPYAELEAAHAAGKIIQMKLKDYPDDTWDDIPDPKWGGAPDEYRIKPEPAKLLGQHGPKGSPALCGPSANPVVVNEPPKDEKQPEEPAWIPHDGGPCPLKDEEVEVVEVKYLERSTGRERIIKEARLPGNFNWRGVTGYLKILAYRVLRWKPGHGPQAASKADEPSQAEAISTEPEDKRLPPLNEADPVGHCAVEAACVHRKLDELGIPREEGGDELSLWGRVEEYAKAQPTQLQQAWTPAVGDTVRLKSGGPVMTVMDKEENGEFWCLWFDPCGNKEGLDFPAVCLTPDQP